MSGLTDQGYIRVTKSAKNAAISPRVFKKTTHDGFILEIYKPAQAPEHIKSAYAPFFRRAFVHWPYCEFVYRPDNPSYVLGPSEWLKFRNTEKTDIYDLDTLDAQTLPSGFERVMDPAITNATLRERCLDDGYLTIVTDPVSDEMVGLLHVRFGSLRRIFETEEWSDPKLFSQSPSPLSSDQKQAFFGRAKHHLKLDETSPIVTVSAVAIDARYRGRPRLFFDMMSTTASCMSDDERSLPFLAEIPHKGPAREIDIATNDRLIHGLVDTERDVVFTEKVEDSLQYYATFDSFRAAIKKRRSQRRLSFIPSPSNNPKVVVSDLGEKGRGVIAKERIDKGECIARFEGEEYLARSALELPKPMVDHAIQVGPFEYVHGAHGLAELVNHSCTPNAGIRDRVEIFAARDIEPGEEICWDYRCSENSNWRLDTCCCETVDCTGSVGNFTSLSPEKKADYLARGLISEWIVDDLQSGKK